MEKIKKYFEFKGAISGLNYFLRVLLSTIVSFIGGFLLGLGITEIDASIISVGLIIIVPSIIFHLTTIYKRALAVLPEKSTIFTITFILLQLITSVSPTISIIILATNLYLIFGKSKVTEFNG